MKKEDVIAFFDKMASGWDADMVRSEKVISAILDAGDIGAGKQVLDVACGTGVLFPDYLARNVESVTGVDISSEMVKIAEGKFQEDKIRVICADVQEYDFQKKFDCIMIYNAFPHFPEPEKLFAKLSQCLYQGGRITVAHGSSRAVIDAHHAGCAKHVSMGLMEEEKLAALMGQWFQVDKVVSDEEKYIVSGILI